MALKKDYEHNFVASAQFPWGQIETADGKIILEDAYIKVITVNGSKETVTANVSIKSEEKELLVSYDFSPSMEGSNFIKQAYEYLKTLPEFSDAQDV